MRRGQWCFEAPYRMQESLTGDESVSSVIFNHRTCLLMPDIPPCYVANHVDVYRLRKYTSWPLPRPLFVSNISTTFSGLVYHLHLSLLHAKAFSRIRGEERFEIRTWDSVRILGPKNSKRTGSEIMYGCCKSQLVASLSCGFCKWFVHVLFNFVFFLRIGVF